MREYELMYILDPTLDEDSTKALAGQIEEFMVKQGISVEETEPWGKRRMAYRIGKHWDGYYVLSLLKAAPGSVAELERRLRVTDGVLRFITVRVDEERAKIERQRAKKDAQDAIRRQKRGVAAEQVAEATRRSDESEAPGAEAPDTGRTSESAEVGEDKAVPAEEGS